MFKTFLRNPKMDKAFKQGEEIGLEEGIRIGLRKHFEISSELTEDENELLQEFLIRHNFVLCWEPQYGGFRVRNAKYNPQRPKVITVTERDEQGKIAIVTKSLISHELTELRRKRDEERERLKRERWKIINI